MVDEPAGDPDDPSRLVPRAVTGDEHALARIVRLHHVVMTRACYVATGDREQAAAAVAAAWPVALERLSMLGDHRRLAPWLCAIAMEQVVRPSGFEISLGGGLGTVAGADRRWPEVPAGHDDALLGPVLGRLAPADRALLALRYVAGLSPSELDDLPWLAERASAAGIAALRERLASALGLAMEDGAGVDAAIEQRLAAYAAIPVHPVDADAVADGARDDVRMRRSYVLSVAVALAAAAFLVVSMYLLASGSPR